VRGRASRSISHLMLLITARADVPFTFQPFVATRYFC